MKAFFVLIGRKIGYVLGHSTQLTVLRICPTYAANLLVKQKDKKDLGRGTLKMLGTVQ